MKSLTFFFALLISSAVFCQNDNVTFDAYLKKFDENFNSNVESEAFDAALINISEFFLEYSRIDTLKQTSYKHLLPHMKYNQACLLALSGKKSLAVQSLKEAVQFGYMDYQHIIADSDLDAIRDDEEFIDLLKSIRETGDYLYILKKDAGYSQTKAMDIPEFTYEDENHESLKSLRTTYKLDSVAGTGDEFSRQLNLMRWVHNMIPHDGNKENPIKRNSLDLIAVCSAEKRGLNCRGLSVVLNDAYLAMGYKSRFLTCLPKNLNDPDCHVINVVYSNTYNKWLWMDPTNEAYVMDENAVPLSVHEVRQKLIDDEPLVLNSDANWNHKETVTADEYLYRYMAKNLYWFECPIENTFDLESSRKEGKVQYIRLYPEGFYPEEKNSESIIYTTTNPEQFWKVD